MASAAGLLPNWRPPAELGVAHDPDALRVCTWNVHCLQDDDGQPRLDEMLVQLVAYDADVYLLQEFSNFRLFTKDDASYTSRLVPDLNPLGKMVLEWYCEVLTRCAPGPRPAAKWAFVTFAGNAILSRHPMVSLPAAVRPKDGSPEQPRGAGPSGRQQLRIKCVQLDIEGHPSLLLHNVHLDHRREPTRHTEWQEVMRIHSEPAPRKARPQLFAGDFNALTKSDYSETRWAEIAHIRARTNWEAPVSSLCETIADAGWVDVYARCNRRSDSVLTCRFNTRIDYIYTNRAWEDHLRCTNCIIDRGNVSSDHKPVIADFAWRP